MIAGRKAIPLFQKGGLLRFSGQVQKPKNDQQSATWMAGGRTSSTIALKKKTILAKREIKLRGATGNYSFQCRLVSHAMKKWSMGWQEALIFRT